MQALISSNRFVLPAQSKRVSELEDPSDETASLFAKFIIHLSVSFLKQSV